MNAIYLLINLKFINIFFRSANIKNNTKHEVIMRHLLISYVSIAQVQTKVPELHYLCLFLVCALIFCKSDTNINFYAVCPAQYFSLTPTIETRNRARNVSYEVYLTSGGCVTAPESLSISPTFTINAGLRLRTKTNTTITKTG